MDGGKPLKLIRYLPHVVVATAAVIALPVAAIWFLEDAGRLQSPFLSALVGATLSFAVASAGSALWVRTRGARDLLFGELMIWGWLRRAYTEHRLKRVAGLFPNDRIDAPPERQLEILKSVASALEARDPYTHGHTRRVARHAYMTAKEMHLSEKESKKVHTAAAVHDVGKIHIPLDVLNKPGKLTDDEFAAVKQHAAAGAAMVTDVGDPELTAIVRHHHERLDGRGYPDGISGTDIPLGARIIAVADTFDAITSSRSYRSACKHKKALDILKKEAGTQLDPVAVRAFVSYYTGRGTRRWWALLTSAPQRIGSWFAGIFARTGGAAVANAVLAAGTAAVIGAGGTAPAVAADAGSYQSGAEVAAASSVDGSIDTDRSHDGDGTASGDSDERQSRGDDNRRDNDDGSRDGDGDKDGPGPGDGPGDDPGDGPGDDPGQDPGEDPGGTDPPGDDGGTPPPGGDSGGGPIDQITDSVDDSVDDVSDGVDDAVDDVGDAVDGATDAVDGVTKDLGDAVDGATKGLGGAAGDLLP